MIQPKVIKYPLPFFLPFILNCVRLQPCVYILVPVLSACPDVMSRRFVSGVCVDFTASFPKQIRSEPWEHETLVESTTSPVPHHTTDRTSFTRHAEPSVQEAQGLGVWDALILLHRRLFLFFSFYVVHFHSSFVLKIASKLRSISRVLLVCLKDNRRAHKHIITSAKRWQKLYIFSRNRAKQSTNVLQNIFITSQSRENFY